MKMKQTVLAVTMCVSMFACDTVQKIASVITPSNVEMALGIKQALEQGLNKSFDDFKNPQSNALLAFTFPGEAQKVVNTLNNLGLGSLVNTVTSKANNAIASAVTSAKPIFINSLKKMSFSDAAKILLSGNQTAATDYFKSSTKNELMVAFRPIADSTIKAQGIDKEWGKIANAINNFPLAGMKVENTLTDFIAARAVDGMYNIVANEEKKIRTDISARSTDVMKRVFAYADEQKAKTGTN